RSHDGQALTLTGPEALTPGDQVTTLAQALGRPLRYEPLPNDAAPPAMAVAPPPAIVDALFRFFSDGEFDDSPVVDTVNRITNRPATPFDHCAHTHGHRFHPQAPPPPTPPPAPPLTPPVTRTAANSHPQSPATLYPSRPPLGPPRPAPDHPWW